MHSGFFYLFLFNYLVVSQLNEFQLSVSICMICIISKAENIYMPVLWFYRSCPSLLSDYHYKPIRFTEIKTALFWIKGHTFCFYIDKCKDRDKSLKVLWKIFIILLTTCTLKNWIIKIFLNDWDFNATG